MLLEHDSIGFLSEYSRSDENVYIYKNTEKHKLETAEPLHRLMEGATKHNWGERITIDDCLFYLEEQLSIITETIPQNKLQEYKYIEQALMDMPSRWGAFPNAAKAQPRSSAVCICEGSGLRFFRLAAGRRAPCPLSILRPASAHTPSCFAT